jgi:uncharacterized protein Yka (UPF0111/DUF47 family)
MVPRPAPAAQTTVPQLLDAFGSEVERCARLTRELLAGFPEQPELARDIKDCEHEADRLSRGAVASLFIDRIDPMVVIRWKDIFDALESAADACEHVAHLIEGIELRRG